MVHMTSAPSPSASGSPAPFPTGPVRHVDGGLPRAVALRRALLTGKASARELTERCLRRIDELNPELGSFVALDREGALRAADAADATLAAHRSAGTPAPTLAGLPTAFKDLVDVEGLPTTFGTAAFPAQPAAADAPLVARVRRAGAVLLGKTAVPEFGLSSHSENLIHPPARNPLDPRTSPGGSSGGAAAAVASGMLPLAPGNDGGGSVRIPAAACGLVGLKPGLGAVVEDVSAPGGGTSKHDAWGAPRLAVSGPLARDAADAALLWDAMTQDPRRRGHTPALAAVDSALLLGDAFTGLRVGATTASAFDASLDVVLEPGAVEAYRVAAQRMAGLGARVDGAQWSVPQDYAETFRAVWTAGLAQAPLPAEAEDALGALARDFRREASARGAEAQHAAARRLGEISRGLRKDWGRYDVVLTPGMAQTPRPIGWYTSQSPERDYELQCLYTPYTSAVNVSGLPAIEVPVLWGADGFSRSVQLIGRVGSEVRLLQLAALLMRQG